MKTEKNNFYLAGGYSYGNVSEIELVKAQNNTDKVSSDRYGTELYGVRITDSPMIPDLEFSEDYKNDYEKRTVQVNLNPAVTSTISKSKSLPEIPLKITNFISIKIGGQIALIGGFKKGFMDRTERSHISRKARSVQVFSASVNPGVKARQKFIYG